MKKLLIGLAAGALAVTATTAPVSAGNTQTTESSYEVLAAQSLISELLIDASGLDGALDTCGNGKPQYTVFFPSSDLWFEKLLEAADLTLGQALAQPALVKTVLLYHVVSQSIAPQQLADAQNSVFNSMGGLQLVKTTQFGDFADIDPTSGVTIAPTSLYYYINGYLLSDVQSDINYGVDGITGFDHYGGTQTCNGFIYAIDGILAPVSAVATTGLTSDGSTTQASGEGLPATGSESLALTYAALASLIAGAGVLVIRRRSVA